MDGQQFNNLVGLVVSGVGLMAWAMVFRRDPHRHGIATAAMLLLSLGMFVVSAAAVSRETWVVGVIAAANRTLVAGLGIRELWNLYHDAPRARHEP